MYIWYLSLHKYKKPKQIDYSEFCFGGVAGIYPSYFVTKQVKNSCWIFLWLERNTLLNYLHI